MKNIDLIKLIMWLLEITTVVLVVFSVFLIVWAIVV
jgi:hypothetical protein